MTYRLKYRHLKGLAANVESDLTLDEAKELLDWCEKEDHKKGEYVPDNYEIVEDEREPEWFIDTSRAEAEFRERNY